MTITLIGYRGSGKTSVAPLLAARLGWRWVDADAELERRAGCSIRDLFAAEGEAFFRRLERDLLAELLSDDRLVLAAGGGAVLDAETRARMRAAGPVVWLQASAETLHRRISADPATRERRPNLTAAGGREEVAQLLAQREPLYRQCATLVVDADAAPIEDVVSRILEGLTDHLGGRR